MQRSILFQQWKAARWVLVPLTAFALTAPLVVLVAASQARQGYVYEQAADMLDYARAASGLFPMLAVLAGVSIGLLAWVWDHREGHVYALALPISRASYVRMKFLAGLVLLALPAVALLVGALTAVLAIDVPSPLHAYPFSLALRFTLGMLVMYALAFGFAAGTARLAFWVLLGLVAFLIIGGVLVSFLQREFGMRWLMTPTQLLFYALVRLPGPFHVFGGAWSLIDV